MTSNLQRILPGRRGANLLLLTAIHVAHRIGAAVVFAAMAAFAWRLWVSEDAALRRWAGAIVGVALWQFASGLGNVILGWPLLAAVAHTGGAAALVTMLALLTARASAAPYPGSQALLPGSALRASP